MTNQQLIQTLVSQRTLPEESGRKILREAELAGISVEKLINERRIVEDSAVANAKSAVLRVPYRPVNPEEVAKDLIASFPEETVRAYQVIPISKTDNMLVAGMVNPDDVKAQEALKFLSRQMRVSLGIFLISYGDWQKMMRVYSPYKSEIDEAVKQLTIKPGDKAKRVVAIDEAVGRNEDAPVIRIVADSIKEAVQAGASDVHIEPMETYVRVRFRILGDLHEAAQLPIELAAPVISRVKILSNMKIDENRMPQDGRFRSKILDREIDFRVSTFPTPLGEKVAIRILDPQTGLKSFEKLGFAGSSFERVKHGLQRPYGMVLVTGPTGSGKSTTLYALLQQLNNEDVNIVSLEDPVEYFVAGVNQSQVHPEIGYDFANGLREILRQDPDIIMVGEIRDAETAGLAVNAALTGHIVLSTLHTNNAAGVIPRLIDMKVEPFLLPSALSLMIAQRLVSEICQNCKEAVEAPPQIQEMITRALVGVPREEAPFDAPYKIWHSRGCEVCHGRGITGRRALHEVLEMTPAFERIINEGPTAQKIIAEAKRQGMLTMRQDGVAKALNGLILMEEVLRETEEY
jgi:type IV pilus assembly protein PilB